VADEDYEYGFTPPNHYKPRPNWKDTLENWRFPPPAGGWQTGMMQYVDWVYGRGQRKTPMKAWTKLRMRPEDAQTAVNPHGAKERGLIPPEIFSHVLARSRATEIKPEDDVPGIIIVGWPLLNRPMIASMARRATPARKKLAKPKAAKRKAPKRKAAKRRVVTRQRRKPK
jgi:hypothetical protein